MKGNKKGLATGKSKNRVKPPNTNPEFSSEKLLSMLDGLAIEFKAPDYLYKVVYLLFNKGELIYVGKSENYGFLQRYLDHKKDKEFDKVLLLPVHIDDRINDIEAAFINTTGGKYNKYRSSNKNRIKEGVNTIAGFLKKFVNRKESGNLSGAVSEADKLKEVLEKVEKIRETVSGLKYETFMSMLQAEQSLLEMDSEIKAAVHKPIKSK